MNKVLEKRQQELLDGCAELMNSNISVDERLIAEIMYDLLSKSIIQFVLHNDRGYFCPRCHKQQKSPDPKRPHLKFYCSRCGQRLTHKEN